MPLDNIVNGVITSLIEDDRLTEKSMPAANTPISLNETDRKRLAALVASFSKRAGAPVGRSAVVRKAIENLFLSECLPEKTNDSSKESEPVAA